MADFDPYNYNPYSVSLTPGQTEEEAAKSAAVKPAAAPVDEAKKAQDELIKKIQERVSGTAPTIAELEAKKAREEAIKASMAGAASARGQINPGALQRALMQQQAAIAQNAAQMEQIGKQKELEGYAQTLAQARAGNLTEAQMLQQQSQFQQDLARLYEQMRVQRDIAAQQAQAQFGGSALGALGTLGAAIFSDERLKTDIKDGAEDIHDFLEALGSHKYKYKNPEHGEKTYYSPMAQELEKSEIGSSMVIDTPEGKAVDYRRGLGAILAAQADMHKRIKELEE